MQVLSIALFSFLCYFQLLKQTNAGAKRVTTQESCGEGSQQRSGGGGEKGDFFLPFSLRETVKLDFYSEQLKHTHFILVWMLMITHKCTDRGVTERD